MNHVFLKTVAIVVLAAVLSFLTEALLRKVIPFYLASGVGFFVLFMTLFPLDRRNAEDRGRSYSLARHAVASLVGALVAIGLSILLD